MRSRLQHLGRATVVLATMLAAFVLVGCGKPSGEQPEPLTRIVTTIPALAGLVGPLLPESVSCESLLSPGQSIHGHRMSASQIARASSAQIIFGIGLGLEEGALEYFERTARPTQRVLAFATLVGIESSHAHTHAHNHNPDDPEDACIDEHGLNPHLWLDVQQCLLFVEAAGEALAKYSTDEVLAHDIRARTITMVERIRAIDAEYAAALAPHRGRAILTQHAAFAPLLDRYGLREIAIHRTGGETSPTPGEVAAAVRTLTENKVAAIFVEPQMSDAFARRLAADTRLPIGTLDPLGRGDWFELMRTNLAQLVEALNRSPVPAPGEGAP